MAVGMGILGLFFRLSYSTASYLPWVVWHGI